MKQKGIITSWNDQKGFGFITPDAGGKRLFIHISAFKNKARRPVVNQSVSYMTSTDKQGRPCAVNAALPGDEKTKAARRKGGSMSILGALTFLVAVGVSVLAGKVPMANLILYISLSFITLVLYAKDKSAARKGAWRTPESTLHLLSLAGGWPGALIAQTQFRHKSRKQPFRAIFWLTVLINCVTLTRGAL